MRGGGDLSLKRFVQQMVQKRVVLTTNVKNISRIFFGFWK